MISVKNNLDNKLSDGNQILGEFPLLKNSEIQFEGKNNILYCEPGVTLLESNLEFKGDNAVIYLGKNKYEYKLSVVIHNDCVFHMGIHNYITQKMKVILSEQRHCFIGDSGVISWGVCIRNADAHLIYSCDTHIRQNPTRSVYIGDHVWIGQDCLLLKGTQIDSGSIIGAKTIVTGKNIPHNTIWAGNPAKQIKQGIFWDKDSVHKWKEDRTKSSQIYDDYIKAYHTNFHTDGWIFDYEEQAAVKYDDIDNSLNSLNGSQRKCEYLIKLNHSKKKNRFVHT